MQAIQADKAKLDAHSVRTTQDREKMVFLESFEIKFARRAPKQRKKFIKQARA